jgi:hypothetical protein
MIGGQTRAEQARKAARKLRRNARVEADAIKRRVRAEALKAEAAAKDKIETARERLSKLRSDDGLV